MINFNCSKNNIMKYIYRKTCNIYGKDPKKPEVILLEKIQKHFGFNAPKEISDFLKDEIKKEYLYIDNDGGVMLTDEGKNYIINKIAFENLQLKRMLLSKIADVIIAAITALLTTLLTLCIAG